VPLIFFDEVLAEFLAPAAAELDVDVVRATLPAVGLLPHHIAACNELAAPTFQSHSSLFAHGFALSSSFAVRRVLTSGTATASPRRL